MARRRTPVPTAAPPRNLAGRVAALRFRLGLSHEPGPQGVTPLGDHVGQPNHLSSTEFLEAMRDGGARKDVYDAERLAGFAERYSEDDPAVAASALARARQLTERATT